MADGQVDQTVFEFLRMLGVSIRDSVCPYATTLGVRMLAWIKLFPLLLSFWLLLVPLPILYFTSLFL